MPSVKENVPVVRFTGSGVAMDVTIAALESNANVWRKAFGTILEVFRRIYVGKRD
jgi:hypothetical protein